MLILAKPKHQVWALTLGAGLDKGGVARNETPLHGHYGLHHARDTGGWLRVSDVTLDRADEERFVCGPSCRKYRGNTPYLNGITSLCSGAVALEVCRLVEVEDAGVGISPADSSGLGFGTRAGDTSRSTVTETRKRWRLVKHGPPLEEFPIINDKPVGCRSPNHTPNRITIPNSI